MFTEKKLTAQKIATFGPLGHLWFGNIIGSSLAIPAVFFCYIVQSIFPSFLTILLVASIFFSTIIIQKALNTTPALMQKNITLNKFWGVVLSLLYVPLHSHIIIFGFILFHLLATMHLFSGYKKIIVFIEKFPGALGIMCADLFSGLIVNLIIKLVLWITG